MTDAFLLDVAVLSELALDYPHLRPAAQPGTGLMINGVADKLAGACVRLLSLLDDPGDIAALAPLAPLANREILYRLLTGPAADMMRHIALADGSLGHGKKQDSLVCAIGARWPLTAIVADES